jgi:flagellar biosynthesis protein FliQ
VSVDALLDLWRSGLTATLVVSAPFLLATLAVGLAIAILQTATQLQEAALTFVPKLAVAALVIVLGGHWVLDRLGSFTTHALTLQAEQAVAQRALGRPGLASAPPDGPAAALAAPGHAEPGPPLAAPSLPLAPRLAPAP